MPLPMLMSERKLAGGNFLIWLYHAVEFLQKYLHGGDAGCDCGLRGALGAGFDGAAPQHVERGNDLAFDALLDDREEKRPDVGGSAERNRAGRRCGCRSAPGSSSAVP